MSIDWDFIGRLEGFALAGYVPRNGDGAVLGDSGVTIASGVDLGQFGPGQIARWAVADDLRDRLAPYCGLRRERAATCLAIRPLTLTRAEAGAVDEAVRAGHVARLRARYDAAVAASAAPTFAGLPDAAQTVIVSISFQYGDLAAACPRFWRACVAQDWPAAIGELERFGDRYPIRRHAEAARLRTIAAV